MSSVGRYLSIAIAWAVQLAAFPLALPPAARNRFQFLVPTGPNALITVASSALQRWTFHPLPSYSLIFRCLFDTRPRNGQRGWTYSHHEILQQQQSCKITRTSILIHSSQGWQDEIYELPIRWKRRVTNQHRSSTSVDVGVSTTRHLPKPRAFCPANTWVLAYNQRSPYSPPPASTLGASSRDVSNGQLLFRRRVQQELDWNPTCLTTRNTWKICG